MESTPEPDFLSGDRALLHDTGKSDQQANSRWLRCSHCLPLGFRLPDHHLAARATADSPRSLAQASTKDRQSQENEQSLRIWHVHLHRNGKIGRVWD